MKILQINNVYGEKSTGTLTRLIYEGLSARGHASLVVYGRGRTVAAPGVVRLCPDWYGKANALLAKVTGVPHGGCLLATHRLKKRILREKPDVVHLQCVNGNFVNIYRLVSWLRERKIKTVVSLHGEFLYAEGPGQEKMRRAFAGFGEDCVVCAVSPWTAERGKRSDILKDIPFRTVYNGVDRDVFCPGENPGENVVLHVTAHFSGEKDHGKGGWYVLELARRMPEVTFLVAGRADRTGNVPENVKLLGEIRDPGELAALYQKAKLTLLTSRWETFSMPCAESLCCGTPVVGFRAGGPESIALPEYTEFVPFGDVDALEGAVRRELETLRDARAIAAAAEIYDAGRMVKELEELYGSLL